MLHRSRKDTQLLSYFAGLFDGEGYVGAYRSDSTKTYKLNLGIANRDALPLAIIKREFEGSNTQYQQGTNGNVFFLRYNHYRAQPLIEALIPYTMIKRGQLKVALGFLNHRRRDHRRGTHLYPCKRCERYVIKLKGMKQGQGVNSVNPLREYRAKPEEVVQDFNLARELLEGVETRLSESNKVKSAPEKDIVHN